MIKKVIIPSLLVALAFSSCKKEDSGPAVPEPAGAPSIVIHQPTGSHFHAGDTIAVHVTATDPQQMHNLKAWLISVSGHDTLWTAGKHTHGAATLLIDSYYVVEEPAGHGHGHDEEEVNLVVLAQNEAGKTATETRKLEIHYH